MSFSLERWLTLATAMCYLTLSKIFAMVPTLTSLSSGFSLTHLIERIFFRKKPLPIFRGHRFIYLYDLNYVLFEMTMCEFSKVKSLLSSVNSYAFPLICKPTSIVVDLDNPIISMMITRLICNLNIPRDYHNSDGSFNFDSHIKTMFIFKLLLTSNDRHQFGVYHEDYRFF